MQWVLPLALLIIFEMLADIFAKEWQLHTGWWRAGVSLGCYMVANTFWLFALRNGSGLARGGLIFAVACAVLAIVIGLWMYREEVSVIQMVGIALGVVSLGLIFWEESPHA